MFTKHVKAFTKDVDVEARTAEQIVSVFGNVDLGKDRVNFGAFKNSLERWKSGPNVLPAYFSHQWDDPFSNIAAVVDAEELPPGDSRLPDELVDVGDGTQKSLRDLGGLWVKYQFDAEGLNPKADQVFRLLEQRRLVQASFAYDIVRDRKSSNGIHDLDELDIIEVGPTLLGMNPATTLVASAKSIAAETGLSEEKVLAVLKASEKDANHTFIPSEEDDKCLLCGRGVRAMAHISRLSNTGDAELKRVQFTGSLEERQGVLHELVQGWAADNNVGNGGFYYCYLSATFDDRVVFLVEGWNDPVGEGAYFEAAFSTNEDGSIALSTPVEVVVEQVITPKNRLKDFDSLVARKQAATLKRQDDEEGTGTGNGEAGSGNPETNPETESETDKTDGELERVRLEADALELSV
jgi:hypothetical protein